MMKRYIIFLLWVATAALASARLGDTEAELVKRLGPPTSRSKVMHSAEGKSLEIGRRLFFRQDDWTIECDIIDERCARTDYGKAGRWTDDHFLAVLSANAKASAGRRSRRQRKRALDENGDGPTGPSPRGLR